MSPGRAGSFTGSRAGGSVASYVRRYHACQLPHSVAVATRSLGRDECVALFVSLCVVLDWLQPRYLHRIVRVVRAVCFHVPGIARSGVSVGPDADVATSGRALEPVSVGAAASLRAKPPHVRRARQPCPCCPCRGRCVGTSVGPLTCQSRVCSCLLVPSEVVALGCMGIRDALELDVVGSATASAQRGERSRRFLVDCGARWALRTAYTRVKENRSVTLMAGSRNGVAAPQRHELAPVVAAACDAVPGADSEWPVLLVNKALLLVGLTDDGV